MSMTYSTAIRWLYGLETRGIKFGLDNMKRLCALLGHPERAFRSVHIAGTNGKGSTAAMLTTIAGRAGLSCGLITSPHLIELTERIRIGEREIPRKRLAELTEDLIARLDEYNRHNRKQPLLPTFFEVTVAIGFQYLAESHVDLAVIETGLGGRLDSTNVVRPVLCILTPIGIEHTQYLGNTYSSIAREKAGIFKPGAQALSAEQHPEALAAITAAAERVKIPLFVCGEHFNYSSKGEAVVLEEDASEALSLTPSLIGEHQKMNAALAAKAARMLASLGWPITDRHIADGIAHTRWPGRLERFGNKPVWLLDSAHNPHATETLARYLGSACRNARILCVYAAMSDKDFTSSLRLLEPYVAQWIFTRPVIHRASPPDALAKGLSPGRTARVRSRVSDALALARKMAADYDVVLITGSIFLLAESRPIVVRHTKQDVGI